MAKQTNLKSTPKRIVVIVLAAACLAAALLGILLWPAEPTPATFDPLVCMETIPEDLEGLKILQGHRTRKSILKDMVPNYCNAQVYFRRMGDKMMGGRVLFKVTVEYTGEVMGVEVVESTILSEEFLRNVSEFILGTDFVSYSRDEANTVFLYPMRFGEEESVR